MHFNVDIYLLYLYLVFSPKGPPGQKGSQVRFFFIIIYFFKTIPLYDL